MIQQNAIITMDDNKEYFITSVVEVDNERFVVLFEINNFKNRKICIEETIDNKLVLTELPDCEENKDIFLKIISELSKELEEQE